MTREERLRFCKVCKNKKFNPEHGIVCGLTDLPADFEDNCPDFSSDSTVESPAQRISGNLLQNTTNAKVAIIIFWAIFGISILSAISDYLEYDLLIRILEDGMYTDREININDIRQGILALGIGLLSLGSIVIFLMWFGRAYSNLKRMGIRTRFSEGMAIWGFIIPIVSLFRPPQITSEIAEAYPRKITEFDPHYVAPKMKLIIGLWWDLFPYRNLIGNILFRTLFKDESWNN